MTSDGTALRPTAITYFSIKGVPHAGIFVVYKPQKFQAQDWPREGEVGEQRPKNPSARLFPPSRKKTANLRAVTMEARKTLPPGPGFRSVFIDRRDGSGGTSPEVIPLALL